MMISNKTMKERDRETQKQNQAYCMYFIRFSLQSYICQRYLSIFDMSIMYNVQSLISDLEAVILLTDWHSGS